MGQILNLKKNTEVILYWNWFKHGKNEKKLDGIQRFLFINCFKNRNYRNDILVKKITKKQKKSPRQV